MKYSPGSRVCSWATEQAASLSAPLLCDLQRAHKGAASTAPSRTKMKLFLVGRAAASRRMVYSPLRPTAVISWKLVGYTD